MRLELTIKSVFVRLWMMGGMGNRREFTALLRRTVSCSSSAGQGTLAINDLSRSLNFQVSTVLFQQFNQLLASVLVAAVGKEFKDQLFLMSRAVVTHL